MQFLILNLIIFLVTFIGGILPLFWRRLQDSIPHAVSFASGVLLGAAALHMLPEATEEIGWPALIVTGVGFALFYLPQRYHAHHSHEEGNFKTLGYIAYLGITLHSLTDGIGVGAVGEGDSIYHVVFGVAVHKFPATVALSLLLAASGFSRRHTLWLILFFAITTPVGAYLTQKLLLERNNSLQGYALAFSAGNFLAVVLADLSGKLPTKEKRGILLRLTLFALGFLANALHLH